MSRIEKWLLAALVATAGVYLLPASTLRVTFAQVALTVAPAAGAVLAYRAARRGARGAVATWLLLAVASAGVALGQAVWAWRQLVLGEPPPFPSVSYVLFVAFHPLFAAALLLSLREGGRSEARREIVQDALLACAGIALVLLRFVFEPLQAARPWLTYSELVWIVGGQFVAQLSLVAAAIVIIWRHTVLSPRAMAAIVLVAVTNGAGNILLLAGLDPDPGSPGDAFDLVWLIGWLLFAAAGAAGGSASATAWTGRTAAWLSMVLRRVLAPVVTLMMTATIVDIAMVGGASLETTVALGIAGGLLALRLVGTVGASDRIASKRRELARTRELVDLSRTLAAAPRVEDALDQVTASVVKLLHGSRVWLERVESDDTVRVTAAHPALPDRLLAHEQSCSHWLSNRRTAQGLIGGDAHVHGPDGQPVAPRTWLAAASVRFGDSVAGALAVERADRGFDAGELELLGAFADQAAVAVENARLVEDARRSERANLRTEKLASLGQLAAGVAHEINNPLTAIHSAAEMLVDAPADEQAAAIDIIRTEAARTARIVRGMLDFVRPPEPASGPVDIADLLGTMLRNREVEHARLGIVTRLELADLPPILGDEGPLAQVFLNLIVNAEHALESVPGERTLSIAGNVDGDVVQIQVHDSGPGIPADTIGRIFDPFFTTKAVGQGTGLGLSVSYGIVRQMGGTISVDSGSASGTAFTIRLPRAERVAAAATRPAPEVGATPPRTILIVEDEASIRLLVSRYLTRLGHNVQTADNGRAALDMLAQRTFDVILTDLKMPEMNGEELYLRLREMNASLAARVLFVSGDTVAPETRDFLARTGCQFIGKPFDLSELAARVAAIGAASDGA